MHESLVTAELRLSFHGYAVSRVERRIQFESGSHMPLNARGMCRRRSGLGRCNLQVLRGLAGSQCGNVPARTLTDAVSVSAAPSVLDVAQALADKMIERHPHVFSEAGDGRTADQQTLAWETLKAEKRAAKGAPSIARRCRHGAPCPMRAEKLTKRAARINFDWPTPEPVLEKLEEELAELKEARVSGDQEHVAEEMGDILFVMANLARKLKVDPEEALRRANAKFTRRFQYIETKLAEQGRTGPQPLDDMEALWLAAKRDEKAAR